MYQEPQEVKFLGLWLIARRNLYQLLCQAPARFISSRCSCTRLLIVLPASLELLAVPRCPSPFCSACAPKAKNHKVTFLLRYKIWSSFNVSFQRLSVPYGKDHNTYFKSTHYGRCRFPPRQAGICQRFCLRSLPVTIWTQASPAKFFKALLSPQSSAIIWQVLFSTLNMATAVPPKTTNDKKIYPVQQAGLITASSAWKQITIYSFTIYKSEVLCGKNAWDLAFVF